MEDDDELSPIQLTDNSKKPTVDRARKLAEREAYLRRPPNQTVTIIKS